MTSPELYALTGTLLFCISLHALVTDPELVRKIVALNIMSSGVFLLLVATAWRGRGIAPDPVPHAMVLTGIVVAVSATALALALARRVHSLTGRASLPEDSPE